MALIIQWNVLVVKPIRLKCGCRPYGRGTASGALGVGGRCGRVRQVKGAASGTPTAMWDG